MGNKFREKVVEEGLEKTPEVPEVQETREASDVPKAPKVSRKADKKQREFYIPRLNRERSLYGTEFEIKLRNELTQRAIARECADWMRKKARFKSFSTPQAMQSLFEVEGGDVPYVYMPFEGLTTTGLGTKLIGFIKKTVIDLLSLVIFLCVFILAVFTRIETVWFVVGIILISVIVTLILGEKFYQPAAKKDPDRKKEAGK